MFDVAHVYGKDTLLMIHWLGTDYLPKFFALKGRLDARLNKMRFVPRNLVDRTMHLFSRMLPEALPARVLVFRKQFEHHLILKSRKKASAKPKQFCRSFSAATAGFYATLRRRRK